jgi:hypothetical protein
MLKEFDSTEIVTEIEGPLPTGFGLLMQHITGGNEQSIKQLKDIEEWRIRNLCSHRPYATRAPIFYGPHGLANGLLYFKFIAGLYGKYGAVLTTEQLNEKFDNQIVDRLFLGLPLRLDVGPYRNRFAAEKAHKLFKRDKYWANLRWKNHFLYTNNCALGFATNDNDPPYTYHNGLYLLPQNQALPQAILDRCEYELSIKSTMGNLMLWLCNREAK